MTHQCIYLNNLIAHLQLSHCLGMNYYVNLGGHSSQWISHKMNIRHPGQLKKLNSWGPFWSYQLNSTANLAHLPRNGAKWAELAVLFIFSTAMGAKPSFYMKFIAT